MRNEKRKIGDSQGVIFKECANVSKTSKTRISPEKVEKAIAALVKRVNPKNAV